MRRSYSGEKYLWDLGEKSHRTSGNQFSYRKRDTEPVFCGLKKNVHRFNIDADLIFFHTALVSVSVT